MINAGRMDQRITLQRAGSPARDAVGQKTVSWADLATVWAAATTKKGREFFAADAATAEASVVFRIRYRADLLLDSAALRVVWKGRTYDVTEPPQDVDGQHVAMDLMCTTGTRESWGLM